MNTPDINLLSAEKGNPCVSIVIPTHQYTRDRMQNPALVGRAIQKAKKMLAHSAWPQEKIDLLENRFAHVLENIDYIRLQEGLAIYVSPNVANLYLLPFPVKEKVVVGPTFELRDLFYFSQYLQPYFLLAISKKRLRLFKGRGRDIQEIINEDFPKQYIEEYEYARPSIGSPSSQGLKAFERDKSIVQETRLKSFIRLADGVLDKYLRNDSLLFVAGVGEEITNFEQVSHHRASVAGRIPGNYDLDAVHPLAESAWKKISERVQKAHHDLLHKLREGVGKNMAVTGIVDVWRAAMEGKGLNLLLEKDYEVMAYRDVENASRIVLNRPAGKYDVISHAAGALLETVREKGGQVVILENQQLAEHEHIALLLRY